MLPQEENQRRGYYVATNAIDETSDHEQSAAEPEETNTLLASTKNGEGFMEPNDNAHHLTTNILIGIRFILATYMLFRELITFDSNPFAFSSRHHAIFGLPTVTAVLVWKAIELKVKWNESSFFLLSFVSFIGSLLFMTSGILIAIFPVSLIKLVRPSSRSHAFITSFWVGGSMLIVSNIAESLIYIICNPRTEKERSKRVRKAFAPFLQAVAFALLIGEVAMNLDRKVINVFRIVSPLLIIVEGLLLSGLQTSTKKKLVQWNAFFKIMASISSLVLVYTFDKTLEVYENQADAPFRPRLEIGLLLPLLLFTVCLYFEAEKVLSEARGSRAIVAVAILLKAIIPTGLALWCLIELQQEYIGGFQRRYQRQQNYSSFIWCSFVLAFCSFVEWFGMCYKYARFIWQTNGTEGASVPMTDIEDTNQILQRQPPRSRINAEVGTLSEHDETTFNGDLDGLKVKIRTLGDSFNEAGNDDGAELLEEEKGIQLCPSRRDLSTDEDEHVGGAPPVTKVDQRATNSASCRQHFSAESSSSSVNIIGSFFLCCSYSLLLASFFCIFTYSQNRTVDENKKVSFVTTIMILNICVAVMYLIHSLCWIKVHLELQHDNVKSGRYSLSEDTFTLMMFAKPFTQPWLLGFTVFALQMTLTIMILLAEIRTNKKHVLDDASDSQRFLDVPYDVNTSTRIGQVAGMIIILYYQTDYWTASTLLTIRFTREVQVPQEMSILLPNIIKLVQSLGVLGASTILILQSDNIIDLVKDYTAILFISEIDDFVFNLAYQGYLGPEFKERTMEAKDKEEIDDAPEHTFRLIGFMCFLGTMLGLWVYVSNNQLDHRFFRVDNPACFDRLGSKRVQPLHYGDGVCDTIFNFEECDFDGGDCVVRNLVREAHVVMAYPDCHVLFKGYIGNGRCDGSNYNSEACGWDGGDCESFNDDYPSCNATNPWWVGDGFCDGDGEDEIEGYMNESCGYDGGDCAPDNYPDCTIHNPYTDIELYFRGGVFQDGVCHSAKLNIEECGFEGGDCYDFNSKYPQCEVPFPVLVGDGDCNGGEYFVEECGFEEGDCDDFVARYPDCDLTSRRAPTFLGNGICMRSEYNTLECGWEDGDCITFNAMYPDCKAPEPFKIGDGKCDGDEYSTEECGRDGSDCN